MNLARIESTQDISNVLKHLSDLGYETSAHSKKIGYVSQKKGSTTEFKEAIRVATKASAINRLAGHIGSATIF